ncbi:hypothetical protein C7212DRAFT_211607 [Tuber magnatum]|uniref:Cytochrome P450 n=1 Tax=Tuber magnatum TaxID=42249 RepID=A0A317SJZ4_9PEZI|nr:hypothetical protein C7212DRAFT_211607 [Tuber magnatum]
MSLLDPHCQATIAACAAFLTQQLLSPIPEVSTTKSILFYTIANNLLALALKRAGINILLHFLMHISLINISYLTSLTFFTVVHRLYFHPLRKFPGGKIARLSKLYEAWINYNGRNGPVVRDLCRKYGDFIRTGPNELAINNVEAVEIIWGRTQPTARGPFYEFANFIGERHLVSQRNKAIHASWRRIWFAPRVLKFWNLFTDFD